MLEAIENFKGLWINEDAYKKHLEKRLKMRHIKDASDYINKTLKCLAEVKEYKIAKYENIDVWDRVRYFDNKEWIVIFAENGTLLTSHKKEKTELDFEEKHKKLGAKIEKGDVSNGFKKFFRELQNKFRIL